MSALIYIVMALTIAAIAGMIAAMVITALAPRYVHPRLHGLQRLMQNHMAPEWVRNQPLDAAGQPLEEDGLAIFDTLTVQESEPSVMHGSESGLANDSTVATMLTDATTLPQGEALLFLRAEIGVQLGFDLDIRGTIVNLTRRQYHMLADYAGLALDTVQTPEVYLGRHGITALHIIRRRGR